MNIPSILSDWPVGLAAKGYQENFSSMPHNPAMDDTLVQAANGEWYPVDAQTCGRVICGFMTQPEAGFDLLYACSRAGFVGAQPGCTSKWCEPYAGPGECNAGETVQPLPDYYPESGWDAIPFPTTPIQFAPVQSLTPPFPSITPQPPFTGTIQQIQPPSCGFSGWVNDHPVLAVAAIAAGYMVLRKR